MALMAYLHGAWGMQSPLGWNVLKEYPVLYHGLLTGLVGAAAVAFWMFLVDILNARPFYTPAALGSAVLLGATHPEEIQISLGVVTAYSFLHLTTFIVVGIAFAWLARGAGRARFWGRTAGSLVLLEGLFLGTLVIVGGWVIQLIGWFTIVIANLVAVVSMALWLWRARRDTTAPPLGAPARQHA
jgi:hypothetical protein